MSSRSASGSSRCWPRRCCPPPDKHRGLTDVETRYRQRYVDLEANERTREIFRVRHAAIHAIRSHLNGLGFTEVEGPVLQTIQGGASARPFVTHHNALDIDLYLRIALELHLKRLIVGGLERVFEIGRVFRNEGIDTRHNPEFTMLEAYQAFADYHDMMDLTEGLVRAAAKAALGDTTTVHYAGQAIDLATPWPRARFADMIAEKTGATMHPDMPIAQARAVLDRLHIPYESSWGAGRLMKEVYDEKVQHDVVGPVFCIDYPREVSPLARVHRDDPAYVERFELIVAGFELCNAYSEQNDPAEQLAAFEAEARAKAGGDPEAGDVDLRLRPRARARDAADGWPGHRDRPAGHAAGQRRLDPRGDPLPDAAPRVRPASGWRAGRGAAPARRADAHRTGQRRRAERRRRGPHVRRRPAEHGPVGAHHHAARAPARAAPARRLGDRRAHRALRRAPAARA